jgi:hypothetical protein
MLALVLALVPIRDRCWDPRAAASTRVAVSRDKGGCVLHMRSGDVTIDAAACAELRCEPGLASTLRLRDSPRGWAALGSAVLVGALMGAVWVRRRRRAVAAPP